MKHGEVYIDPMTGWWAVDLPNGGQLSYECKLDMEAALDFLDNVPDYDEIARRMLKVILDTPMPSTIRSLPVLGTVTDDGAVLWNAGDVP